MMKKILNKIIISYYKQLNLKRKMIIKNRMIWRHKKPITTKLIDNELSLHIFGVFFAAPMMVIMIGIAAPFFDKIFSVTYTYTRIQTHMFLYGIVLSVFFILTIKKIVKKFLLSEKEKYKIKTIGRVDNKRVGVTITLQLVTSLMSAGISALFFIVFFI